MYYHTVRKKKLVSSLHMEEMIISTLSVFVDHRSLQHGGLEWNKSVRLKSDMYFIAIDVKLQDAIALV